MNFGNLVIPRVSFSLPPPHDFEHVPARFYCPITQELFVDPVICADGNTYERSALEKWFNHGKRTSPTTNEILVHFHLRGARRAVLSGRQER